MSIFSKIAVTDEERAAKAKEVMKAIASFSNSQNKQEYLKPTNPDINNKGETYDEWKSKNAPNDNGSDYDLLGAFKANLQPVANGHFPDTFKKPNHPTFSNQSIYSTADQPGGEWGKNDQGKDTFKPSGWMGSDSKRLQNLKSYFLKREPNSILLEPEQLKPIKSASAQDLQEYLYSYVPRAGIAQVKEHGLLSGNEIAKPENRHLLELARPNGDADRWLKEKDERLAKMPWKASYDGPSVLFGDLDPDKIHDKHPIKKFDATRIKIKLTDLLKDYPDTRMVGSELIPYTSEEELDALDEKGLDEFRRNRHHTLSPEEITALIARGQNPKDMWKDFKDTEGKFYASDVPHAHLITSIGKIPSKYIEFDEEQPVIKQANVPADSAELTPEQSVLAKIRKHLDKAGLAYHIVVENPGKGGASMHKAIGRDEGHSRAVVHAREAQVAWEKEHGYNPDEDWGNVKSNKQAGLLKKSVHWSDDVSKNLLNGRHYPVSYLTGELDELKESIKNRDWNNFKEEVGDSTYAAETILAQRLGLNLPLIGASSTVEKFYARKKKWEEVFDERGVPFNNDYLSGGSNLKKPKKIQAALGLAGHTITKDEARALALKYGGEIEDDWIDNNSLSKLAAAYTASGEKVQGVGLRKMYHSLLEEQGLPGLAVNNEETGDVELSFDGDEAKRKEVFDQLSSRVKAKTGHPITFTPTANPQVSVPVNLSNIDAEKLNAIHHLAYRMSNLYNPNDSAMDSNNSFKEKIADRFRLQVNQRGLQGTVPSRASEQLSGNRPMYDFMLPDQRTRSEEEALSDMPKDQKRRLMKALLGGRGFLDPNQTKVAEAQPRHELVIGASGAGKTTKAKELSEQNGMPVINLDNTDPAWHNFVKDNDNLRNENNVHFHLIEGTKTNLQWKKLMRRIVDEAIAKKEPHIIEGTHLMMLSPKELQNHNLHIVNPSLEEVVQRRENRMRQKEVEKGRHYTKDDYENNRLFATAFYDKIQPAIKKWEKVDSKLNNRINPKLVAQINNKVAKVNSLSKLGEKIVYGNSLSQWMPSMFLDKSPNSLELRVHGGGNVLPKELGGNNVYVIAKGWPDKANTEVMASDTDLTPDFNKFVGEGANAGYKRNSRSITNWNLFKKIKNRDEYYDPSTGDTVNFTNRDQLAGKEEPPERTVMKPIDEVFSYACNGLNIDGKGIYGTPDFYQNLVGQPIKRVVMTPPGYFGHELAGVSKLPGKIMNMFGKHHGLHYFAPLHDYRKAPDGITWEDKGEYEPVLDKFVSDNKGILLGGVALGGAALLYNHFRKKKINPTLVAQINNKVAALLSPLSSLNYNPKI